MPVGIYAIPRKMRKHPEKKLEGWFIKNLNLYEDGLRFIQSQFRHVWMEPCGKRFNQIDILARDKNGIDVLIEVKIRATIYTIENQLQYYMKKWPCECRGIVAAKHIPKHLKSLPLPSDITLWEAKDDIC